MTEDGQPPSVLSICKLFPQKAPEFFQIRIAEHREDLHQLFWLQIPPLIAQQQVFQFRVKSLLDEPCRISAVNGVRRNILHHHGICGDNCAVADLHTRHDDALAPDPHVVSDDRVALVRKLRHVRRLSVQAPPKTLNGYVVALLMRWFAGPMINFVPDAI